MLIAFSDCRQTRALLKLVKLSAVETQLVLVLLIKLDFATVVHYFGGKDN